MVSLYPEYSRVRLRVKLRCADSYLMDYCDL